MQQNNMVETIIGAIVVVVAVVFLVFAYRTTGSANLSGSYELTATLSRVDGLAVGGDVTLAGIKIGTVSDLTLDPKTYQVTMHLRIHSDVKIPDDSSLVVNQPLLMGSTSVSISPGGDDAMLASGDRIRNVQGSIGMSLPDLIGRFIGNGNGGSGTPAAPPKPTTQAPQQLGPK